MKYIIGDTFQSYFETRKTTRSTELNSNTADNYTIGQGLTFNQFTELLKESTVFQDSVKKVDLHHTHKHYARNSLISNFTMEEKSVFNAEIYVHGDNDLLADHITGLHIPGMVILEASRELFIVSLSYLGYGKQRFILNNMSIEFISYVFPTKVHLTLALECLKDTKNEKIYNAHIKVEQEGKIRALSLIKATLVPEEIASFGENLSARDVNTHNQGS